MDNIRNQEKNERTFWRGSFVFYLLPIFSLIALDQYLKQLVFSGQAGNFLNNFQPIFGKELFLNNAFAFSWPLPVWLIYGIYFVALIILSAYVWKNHKNFSAIQKLAWVLIFSGALSNIGERVILGAVRDYIYFVHGIFNLADIYILVGLIFLVLPKRS